MYRVDGGRGDCPVLPALLGELRMGVHGMLGELPLANASLQALLAEPVDSLASLPGVTNA